MISKMETEAKRRRWVLGIAIGLAVGVLALEVFNVWTDPLQFYGWKPSAKGQMHRDDAYRTAGLVRNLIYNGAVIGGSPSYGIRGLELNPIFKRSFRNFSIRGSTIREQSLVLRAALQTKQVTDVIWFLDFFAFQSRATEIPYRKKETFPDYLYDDFPPNDLRYLLSFEAFKLSVGQRFPKIFGDLWTSQTLAAREAAEGPAIFSKEKVLAAFHSLESDQTWVSRAKNAFQEAAMLREFDEFVIPVLESLKDVSVRFVYPPYNIHYFVALNEADPKVLDAALGFKSKIFERLKERPGVEVYDLQADKGLTHDDSDYSDLIHFSPAHDRRIIDGFKTHKWRVTPEQLERNSEKLRDQVKTFQSSKS